MTTAPKLTADAAGRAHHEVTRAIGQQRRDLFSEVKLRTEGPDLLHQPVHQLLRAAHRHCRNVVDGLVGIQLGALSAHDLE